VRWETLTVSTDGAAKLEVRDMWFDARSCAIGSGPTTTSILRAIAWDEGKPWLFALRDEKSVTLVMPRSNDVSAEAMVGSPITVRGGFTRVTLPLGRWGSSSIVANLPTLSLDVPPQPNAHQPNAKKLADSDDGDRQPVEVAVELVQTMSEASPTLLVRRRQPDAVASREPVD
jgi:hypothetical protein